MKTIEGFILGLDGQQKAIVSFFHNHLTQHHDLQGKISYNIPVYYRKSWVCYLNPLKNNGIELAFTKGHRLSNDQKLLNKKKRKYVAGIDLFDISSIPEQSINEIIQEALIVDQLY
ncbi:MAG: DUF1801 domain-containing protein [Ekhidna sp.]